VSRAGGDQGTCPLRLMLVAAVSAPPCGPTDKPVLRVRQLKHCSLNMQRAKQVRIAVKAVRQERCILFQIGEVKLPREPLEPY